MPKGRKCGLCGAKHKRDGRTNGGVVRVDSRFRDHSVKKRRAKFLQEKLEKK